MSIAYFTKDTARFEKDQWAAQSERMELVEEEEEAEAPSTMVFNFFFQKELTAAAPRNVLPHFRRHVEKLLDMTRALQKESPWSTSSGAHTVKTGKAVPALIEHLETMEKRLAQMTLLLATDAAEEWRRCVATFASAQEPDYLKRLYRRNGQIEAATDSYLYCLNQQIVSAFTAGPMY